MTRTIEYHLNEARRLLAQQASQMAPEEHAEAWHAIEREAHVARFDGDYEWQAEVEMEAKMLGCWDQENGHEV